MWQGSVAAIGISAKTGEPIESVPEARAVAGRGLEGDRNWDRGEPEREITLIESEAIEALARESGVELRYEDARRNIITRGVALNHLVGREFNVGNVRVKGIKLNEPCQHLADLTEQKVLGGLVHRGGLRGQILNDGVIRVGDTISE